MIFRPRQAYKHRFFYDWFKADVRYIFTYICIFFQLFFAENVFWLIFLATYVRTYIHGTYVRTYIRCMGGRLATYVRTYIVWWSASGAATSDVSRHGQKSLRSLGTKNRQNHELKQLFWSCFWRGVEIWISLFRRQDVRVLSLPYIVWREPHTLYASLNHVSCDGCRLIHCIHFCMDWGGSESR